MLSIYEVILSDAERHNNPSPPQTPLRQRRNRFPNTQRGRRRRGGGVEHLDHARGFHDVEVICQAAVGEEGLGAHARAAPAQVAHLERRQQPLQGAHEGRFGEGAVELPQPHPPVAPGQDAEAGIA